MSPRLHLSLLLVAGALMGGAFATLRRLGDLGAQVPAMWTALVPAAVGYALAAWLILRRGDAATRATPWVVVGGALLFRLLLVDTAPSLSDDVYRYVWDGRVAAAGLNPYALPPDAAALEPLRDADWKHINHRELVTLYPPLAQAFFLAAHAVAPGVVGLKALLVVVDLLLVGVLWRWLRARGQPGTRAVLYAWHPLPVVEIAGSGHVDGLALLWLCLALWQLEAGRRQPAVLALAAGTLTKGIPLLCLPAFWRRWAPTAGRAWRRGLDPRSRLPLLWLPVLALAAWLPLRDAGPDTWSGLRAYAGKWRFNDSAYGLVYTLIADPKPGWTWDDEALLAARWICLALLGLLALWTALRRLDDPARTAATLLGAQLLLAPTVHPWYALWVLPFTALRPQPAWVAFTWLIFLAYEVLIGVQRTGVWLESSWLPWVEYGPVYALILGTPLATWWRRGVHLRNTGASPTSKA